MSDSVEALLLSCQLPPVSPAERAGMDAAWSAAKSEAKSDIPTTGDAPALDVRLKCTYCQDTLAQEASVYCAGCLAPHHRECFVEHQRCAAPGCGGTLMVEPTPVQPALKRPPQRWRAWLFRGTRAAFGTPGRASAVAAVLLASAAGLGGIYHYATTPQPWTVEAPSTPIVVTLGQTLRLEEPWSENDPPDGIGYTNLSGAANIISRDAIAEVEWAVPHVKGRAIFLVQGLEEGQTQFTLRFSKSRRIKQFEVVVEGDDHHAIARDRRHASLRLRPSRELRRILKDELAYGETTTKRRDVPGKESYYRQALLHFEIAADAGRALAARGDKRSLELLRAAEDAETRARDAYEDFVDREFAAYRDGINRREPRENSIVQLRRVLRALDHECDQRYMRMRLILERGYGQGQALESSTAEACRAEADALSEELPTHRPSAPPPVAPVAPRDPEAPRGTGDAPVDPRGPGGTQDNEAWVTQPDRPGGNLVVSLRNGRGDDGEPKACSYSAKGKTPPYMDGTQVEVTLAARGRSRDFPVKILRAVVTNNTYEVSAHWPDRVFAPLLYEVTVKLNVRKQPTAIKQWFATEYGFTPNHQEVVDRKWLALGDAKQREEFAAENVDRIKRFALQLEALRANLEAAIEGTPDYRSLNQGLVGYRAELDGYFHRYLILLEQGFYQRLLDHMRTLNRIVRDDERSRPGTTERLAQLRKALDTTVALIAQFEQSDDAPLIEGGNGEQR